MSQYKSIPIPQRRILRIDAEDVEVQRGDDVRRGHRAPRMAALHVVRHPDDVLPQSHGLLLEARDELKKKAETLRKHIIRMTHNVQSGRSEKHTSELQS